MWTPDRILCLLALSILGSFVLFFFGAIAAIIWYESYEVDKAKPLGKVVAFVLYNEKTGHYYTCCNGTSRKVADAVLFTVVIEGQDVSCRPVLPIGEWKAESVFLSNGGSTLPTVVECGVIKHPLIEPTSGWFPPD